jgi:hypothetical protein
MFLIKLNIYFSIILYFSGMTLTSGTCTLKKDAQNLVGISIGGGSPLCPCLYIVQIFDNTAASRDGSLAAGINKNQINYSLINYLFE